MSKLKIISVIGPTASGKTSLAISLAKKFNGELINTDSRQIYKYLDIGTAKGNVKKIADYRVELSEKYHITNPKIQTLEVYEIENVPIHLINIVAPDKVLTLAQYQKLAYAVIESIRRRGKLPILVGGTGLYVDAITRGYKIPEVEPDKELRKILDSKTVKQLRAILKSIDVKILKSLNESDQSNPRRLIRQIEIASKKMEKCLRHGKEEQESNFSVLFLSISYNLTSLKCRIRKRAERIIESGLIKETNSLIASGYNFANPAMTAICYLFVKQYLEKTLTKEELLEKIVRAEFQYVKKQITWFKRYNTLFIKNKLQAFKEISEFLKI